MIRHAVTAGSKVVSFKCQYN